MKINNLLKNLLLLSIVTFSSCDIDNIKPVNRVEENKILSDELSVTFIMNKMYSTLGFGHFINLFAGFSVAGTEQTYEYIVGGRGFNTNNLDPQNTAVLSLFYKSCYYIVNTSNFLIKELESDKLKEISPKRKEELIAEAKTFRALANFMLLKTFGQFYDLNSEYGIVLYNKPIDVTSPIVPRSKVGDVYKSILADLGEGIQGVKDRTTAVYFSKTFAQALRAKVYLYKGDYNNAAIDAKAVINNKTDIYKLEASYADIFQKRWSSSDVLFAPHRDGKVDPGINTIDIYTLSPSSSFTKLADAQDSVKGNFSYSSGYDPRFIITYSQKTDAYLKKEQYGKYPYDIYKEGNTVYYLRMSEVYLIHAEAEARRAGGSIANAIASLNAIRKRAKVAVKPNTLTKAQLLAAIRDEKMLELSIETGESWFDLIRYHINKDVNAFALKKTLTNKNKFIAPLPQATIVANKGKVKQNLGYK